MKLSAADRLMVIVFDARSLAETYSNREPQNVQLNTMVDLLRRANLIANALYESAPED